MPTLTSIVIGLAALTATAFASVTGAEADLAKRAPEWNRPHHHHGGHSHGHGHPHPHPARHPANYGAWCRRDNQCYYYAPFSTPFCNKNGKCDYSCPRGWQKKGTGCAPIPKPPQVQSCTYDHNCKKSTVANSHSVCLSRQCQWACNDGFYAWNGKCVPVPKVCGAHKNRWGAWTGGERCGAVEDGYNVCVDGHCVPQCAGYLGYSLFTDNDGNYRCVNLQNDPWNCGSIDNECGPGYNGLGMPICYRGTCSVNCHGYNSHGQLPNGQYYCTNN